MSTTAVVFTVALVIFLSYSVFIYVRFDILPSLSASYYALEDLKKGLGFVFQGVMAVVGFLMTYVSLQVTDGYWFQFLSFLTTAPILFVAAAPKFKSQGDTKTLEAGVHGKSATMSAIMSLLLVMALSIYSDPKLIWNVPTMVVPAALLYLLTGKDTKIYWAEYACFGWFFSSVGMLVY